MYFPNKISSWAIKMQIDLNVEINEHFERLKELSQVAAEDMDESLSARASAMSALSALLRDLTKAQAEILNMQRLQHIEATTIMVLKEFLTPKQHEKFLTTLETALQINE